MIYTCEEIRLCSAIRCNNCQSINYIWYDPPDNDSSKMDIECIKCWNCNVDCILIEVLNQMQEIYSDEQIEVEALNTHNGEKELTDKWV